MPQLFSGLTQSLVQEYDYDAEIEGAVPVDLRGVLYRNGAGLYERGGLRKRALMDGDGMVHAYFFHDRGVRFRNRFVLTEKYLDEEAAGGYLYPTFSTQAPGGVFANLWAGDRIKSQAQISVVVRGGRLFAFDESSLPYELDPVSLSTLGASDLGLPGHGYYSAHSKIDMHTGEWLLFGLHYGRKVELHTTVLDPQGRLINRQVVPLPRYVYLHDCFVSSRHMVFSLHPVEFDLLPFLFGTRSMSDSFSWRPEKGTLVMILGREGTEAPIYIETGASFLWHTLNAYEEGGMIICDFIGYESPDHFIGPDPPVTAVMEGRKGRYVHSGEIRRYEIDPAKRRIRQEVILRGGFEWPFMHPHHRGYRYRYGYCAKTRGDDFFWSGISRIDMDDAGEETYFFAEGIYCGEPVFAPRPGFRYDPASTQEPGWLLTEAFDGQTGRSFLAVFDAGRLQEGPVAKVHLSHHMPFSMHGFWKGRT